MPTPKISPKMSPKMSPGIKPKIRPEIQPRIKSQIRSQIRSQIDLAINIDRLFHALGDPTRRAILDRLSHGPLSVSALAAPLDITLTAVAQHLQILEESGLVLTEKLGRVRTCRIETTGFSALEQWISDHRSLWQQRLDQLSDLLDEPDENE